MTGYLANQARGCQNDACDERSHAAIQQDFINDVGHDSLQPDNTVPKRWPQSVRKLITRMSLHFRGLVWRGCNNKLRVCLIFDPLMGQLAYPSMESDLCACTSIGLSTMGLHWRFWLLG